MQPATDSKSALSGLQSFTQGMKDPSQAYNDAAGQFGVGQAQQNVTGLRQAINNTTNLLNQVAPSVMGRTGQSLVTNAQATHQIANEQAPIQTELNQQDTAYQGANDDYNKAEGRAESMAGNTLSSQQNQRSYLQSLYDNLYGQEQDSAKMAESKRQFDAGQSLEQQKLAASRAAASASASPSFGGSSAPASVGTLGRDAKGGYTIKGPAGNGITMGQYAVMNGLKPSDVATLLMQSGNPADYRIAADINSGKYTPAQLIKMYPQALGGTY